MIALVYFYLVLGGSVRCKTLLLFTFLTMNGQWLKLPCEIVVRVFSDVLGRLQLLITS